MIMYWHIFLAFFIPGIVGYGGGPATIPLIEYEVVDRYGWMTTEQFGEVLAIGNSLPGPIATKMAGYIGYEVGGPIGAAIGLLATVAPTVLAMIALLGLLYAFRHSPKVKRMTNIVRPIIVVLLGVLVYDFFVASWVNAGSIHTIVLIVFSVLCLKKWELHPAYVVLGAMVYGAIFM